MRAGYAQRGSRCVEGVTGVKPVWLGGAQSMDSDRLGLVLSGERGESPAWWSLCGGGEKESWAHEEQEEECQREEGAPGSWHSAWGPGSQGGF